MKGLDTYQLLLSEKTRNLRKVDTRTFSTGSCHHCKVVSRERLHKPSTFLDDGCGLLRDTTNHDCIPVGKVCWVS